jgi:hypothetical protein
MIAARRTILGKDEMSSRDYLQRSRHDHLPIAPQPAVVEENVPAPVIEENAEPAAAPEPLYMPACGVLCDLFWWARPAASAPRRTE